MFGVGGACFRRKIWCSPTRLASVYSVVPRVPLACARFWRCKLRVSEKVKNDELRERYEWAWILGETVIGVELGGLELGKQRLELN